MSKKAIDIIMLHPEIQGNQNRASRVLGFSQPLIRYWLKKSDIPMVHALHAAEVLKIRPSLLSDDFKKVLELEEAA